MDLFQKREQWQTSQGFILATIGSAIGLGNIWRFPTVVGESGGGAFLLVYLIIILILGLPLMLGELSIGRRGKSSIIGAFMSIKPHTPWWLIGAISVFSGILILSFYSVISGWSLYYMFSFLTGQFQGAGIQEVQNLFQSFVQRPFFPLFWQGTFLFITLCIVMRGIHKGIERASTVLMPILFVLLFLLALRSITLDGAWEGVLWFIRPQLAAINIQVVLGALGQVFFSLSLGMGAILTYGSYLAPEDAIPKSSLIISLSDLTIAIVAGFIIIPAVFAFGLEPETGLPLIFITLPLIFGSLPVGQLLGASFFILLSIAALTSALSILEVVVAACKDTFQWSRNKATLLSTLIIFFLSIPSSLSMGTWEHVRFWGFPFLEFLDTITAVFFLPLIGLLTSIFIGWIWTPHKCVQEITREKVPFPLSSIWSFLIKYVVPISMLYILISGFLA